MKKSNVLIVEDDKDLRETWQIFFSNFGFSIHTAAHGLDALEIIDQYPLEIVITDLQMPVKDGYFVLEHLKSKEYKQWYLANYRNNFHRLRCL